MAKGPPSISESLGHNHPEICKEIDYEKNNIDAFNLWPKSNKRIWWRCPNGPDHNWEAPIARRTAGGGCPFCSTPAKRVSITNCMQTVRPDMVDFWHQELNGEITPFDILPGGSSKKYWWKCPEGDDHIWESDCASIASAIDSKFGGIGCPYCVGRKLSSTNRLDLLFPKIAKQWHPTKNGDLRPDEFSSGNDFMAWWQCEVADDHVWQARIYSRTNGTGCPSCDGKQISSTNSLASLHPHLIEEWHPTKNGSLSIFDFAAKSGKKVWWRCHVADDHEWEAFIYTRAEGYGCPYCANRKGSGTTNAVSDTNRLSELFPEIADEWHPTKNGNLRPEDFVFGSHTKVWWQCQIDSKHEWETIIQKRTVQGTGCPSCANYGINLSEPTYYYVMRIEGHNGLWWWKGGISVDPERRADQIQRSLTSSGMMLDVIVHEKIEFNTGDLAVKFEKQMLEINEIRENTVEVFSGSTELFNRNPIEYARNESILDSDSLTSNQRV